MLKSYIFIGILGIFVVFLVVAGFLEVGTPLDKNAIALDTKRLNSFSGISYSIESYYSKNKKLPSSLAGVKMSSAYSLLDPQTKKAYDYKVNTQNSFSLCTEFSTDSEEVAKKNKNQYTNDYYDDYSSSRNKHKKGYDCMEYKISEDRYIDNYSDNAAADVLITPTPTPIVAKTLKDLASTFINANIGYFSIHNAYPWSPRGAGGGGCNITAISSNKNTLMDGNINDCVDELINDGDLTDSFTTNPSMLDKIYISTDAEKNPKACYRPETELERKDQNTIYDKDGIEIKNAKTVCEGNGGNTPCFYCVD